MRTLLVAVVHPLDISIFWLNLYYTPCHPEWRMGIVDLLPLSSYIRPYSFLLLLSDHHLQYSNAIFGYDLINKKKNTWNLLKKLKGVLCPEQRNDTPPIIMLLKSFSVCASKNTHKKVGNRYVYRKKNYEAAKNSQLVLYLYFYWVGMNHRVLKYLINTIHLPKHTHI